MPKALREVFLRSAHNYDADQVSQETGLACRDVSLAKQSFAEESDINTLVRRFGLTGQVPVAARLPTFQDFEGVFDFQTAMNAVVMAQQSFQALPGELRYRFHNNPQEFVEFCSDEANRPEAERLGLVPPKPPAPPVGSPGEPVAPVSGPADTAGPPA